MTDQICEFLTKYKLNDLYMKLEENKFNLQIVMLHVGDELLYNLFADAYEMKHSDAIQLQQAIIQERGGIQQVCLFHFVFFFFK